MIANVSEQVWIDFGLETAVFLDTMAYWLKKNAANQQPHNFKDGRYWTYNTQAAYQKMFPGWSRETIRRIIRNCQKNGLILIDNFNKKRFDKTCWYSLTDKALEYYSSLWLIMKNAPNVDGASLVDSNHALVDSNQPIPKELPSVSNINITISDNLSKTKKENQFLEEIKEVYNEEMTSMPQSKRLSDDVKRHLRKMIRNWPEYEKNGNKFTIESFRDYLKYIKENPNLRFFTETYTNKEGNKKRNNLKTITSDKVITKIINGEYSGN